MGRAVHTYLLDDISGLARRTRRNIHCDRVLDGEVNDMKHIPVILAILVMWCLLVVIIHQQIQISQLEDQLRQIANQRWEQVYYDYY